MFPNTVTITTTIWLAGQLPNFPTFYMWMAQRNLGFHLEVETRELNISKMNNNESC